MRNHSAPIEITVASAVIMKDKFDPQMLAQSPMTTQMQEQMEEQLGAKTTMPDLSDVKLIKALDQIDLPLTLNAADALFINRSLAKAL